jgi:hypothetical protein
MKTKSQQVCLILLWVLLCYLLIKGYGGITPRGIFAIITSGIIIFVPIYKKSRRDKDLKK